MNQITFFELAGVLGEQSCIFVVTLQALWDRVTEFCDKSLRQLATSLDLKDFTIF